MENSEKIVIMNSIEHLCSNTTGTKQILIRLIGANLLDFDDEERIAKLLGTERNKEMYKHLTTKEGAWPILLKALKATCNQHIAKYLEEQLKLLKTKDQAENKKISLNAEKKEDIVSVESSQSSIQAAAAEPEPGPSASTQNNSTSDSESQENDSPFARCFGQNQNQKPDRNKHTAALDAVTTSSSQFQKKAYAFKEGDDKGLIIIISNDFEVDDDSDEKPIKPLQVPRPGSGRDVELMKIMFKGHSILTWRNVTKDSLKIKLDTQYLRNLVHNKNPSFCVVIFSSHGHSNNILYTNDSEEINLYNDLIYKFNHKSVPELKGKPKIFFIQACCGDCLEDKDNSGPLTTSTASIREHSDMDDTFIGRSSRPSHASLRNTVHGSIYIQAISEIFQSHWQDKDLESLHIEVENLVTTRRYQTPEFKPWRLHEFKFPFLFKQQ